MMSYSCVDFATGASRRESGKVRVVLFVVGVWRLAGLQRERDQDRAAFVYWTGGVFRGTSERLHNGERLGLENNGVKSAECLFSSAQYVASRTFVGKERAR